MTRRTRVVATAVAAGVCAGSLVGFLLAGSGGNSPGRRVTTETSTSTAPSTTTSLAVTTTSLAVATTAATAPAPPPDSTTLPPAPAPSSPNADPAAVVRNFITGYSSWSWSDQPDPNVAVRARVRPWVTDAFDARMGMSSSAAYATSLRVAAHEVNTVEITSLDPTEPDTFLSLVSVTITKDGAAPAKRATYITARVAKVGEGWFVDQLIQ